VTTRRTLAFFAATGVLLGGTFVAAKAGLEYFPPLLFVAYRFDIAAVLLLGYVALTRESGELLPKSRADIAGVLATGFVTVGLTNSLLFVGQQHVTSGVASIIASLNPVLTPVFAGLLLTDERLSVRSAGGMLLGLVGVGLVVNPTPANFLAGGMVGKAILLGGAASGALGSVLIRRADADLSSTVQTAWGLPFGALLAHAASLGLGESPAAVVWNAEALVALAYVSVFAGAIAYIAYFGLIEATGAIKANLAFYVVPIVATVGGGVLLNEAIPKLAVAGFLTVFVGFAIIATEDIDLPSIRRTPARTDGGFDVRDDAPECDSD